MGNALRDRRTPLEFAARGQVVEIADKIGSFERLVAVVETDLAALDAKKIPPDWRDAIVKGRLVFGFAADQEQLPMLEGSVQTTVYAVCQRCLEPMQLKLEARLDYLLADSEHEGLEAWELDEATLRPLDIVDESLIMAMPMSVLHGDETQCKSATTPEKETGNKIRPFAALREQMERKD